MTDRLGFPRVLVAAAVGLMVLAFAATGSGAQEAPNVDDEIRVRQCLDAVRKAESDPRACLGVVADRCLERPEETSSGENIACVTRETVVWRQLLNAYYVQLRNVLSNGAGNELETVQSAWATYRDLRCALGEVVHREATLAKVSAAECVLEETGRRAIELGLLIDEVATR